MLRKPQDSPTRSSRNMPVLKNPKHEAFAQARVAGLSVEAAYVEAGYKPHRSNASRLSGRDSIQRRMAELQEAAVRRAEITGARVIKEMARVGLSNAQDLFNEEGKLIPIHELPEDIARAIASIDVVTSKVPGTDPVEVEYTTKIKLWDKNSALEKLAKALDVFEGGRGSDQGSHGRSHGVCATAPGWWRRPERRGGRLMPIARVGTKVVMVDPDTLRVAIQGKAHIDRMSPIQLSRRIEMYRALAAKRPKFYADSLAAAERAREMIEAEMAKPSHMAG
jgi:phage terminase small subunit